MPALQNYVHLNVMEFIFGCIFNIILLLIYIVLVQFSVTNILNVRDTKEYEM